MKLLLSFGNTYDKTKVQTNNNELHPLELRMSDESGSYTDIVPSSNLYVRMM